MSTTLAMLMLFGGCVYLLIGGDILVSGALALSRKLSISPMIVGLTVVAIGTSAPELIVSMHSSLNGHPGIAIGNVVGSNIANVLLVLGVPALIHPIVSDDAHISKQAFFMVFVSVTFVVMCFAGYIGQLDGWLLLGVMATGIVLTLRSGFAMPGVDQDEADEQLQQAIGLPEKPLSILALLLVGSVFLPVGADLAVDGAVAVATNLGISEAAVGSTMVALGTSLPELSTTLVAAFRRNADMALGNVIGSNVLNILVIMGLTAIFVDIPVPEIYLQRDIWFMLACAAILTFYVARTKPVGRTTGLVFCAGYLGYIVAVL